MKGLRSEKLAMYCTATWAGNEPSTWNEESQNSPFGWGVDVLLDHGVSVDAVLSSHDARSLPVRLWSSHKARCATFFFPDQTQGARFSSW